MGLVSTSFAQTTVPEVKPKSASDTAQTQGGFHSAEVPRVYYLRELENPDSWTSAQAGGDPWHKRWYGLGNAAPVRPEILVLEGVNFDFDKSNIRPDAAAILDRVLALLQTAKYRAVKVIDVGYTDSKGTFVYNQSLSERRAKSVRDYFISHGIAADRVLAEGRGETMPVAPNITPSGKDNPAGRAENRRMELEIWY
jgi:outer membrane protein OmpA-like peptidoglycan-associated protein